jgi:hypothetical protein
VAKSLKIRSFAEMMRPFSFLLFFLLPALAGAQVSFVSPLPFGILQVNGDHADLRLRVQLPHSYQEFQYKLSSDVDTSDPREGWHSIAIHSRVIDTLITVPRSLRSYSIYWSAGILGVDTGGIIAGLTPGHVIGIAGQSNAQGNCYTMLTSAEGDIRMLPDNNRWLPAHEPTGGVAGGPWIVMANELFAALHDTLPIGIVNAGLGSTGLTKADAAGLWYRDPAGIADSSVYGRALNRFEHAGGELEALCWIQGETDGGYLPDPNIYRVAFARLMNYFKQDLADNFPIFHLQVGGHLFGKVQSWPAVREAERVLPPSTIVGTAVGRSIDDEFHYSVTTNHAVGWMFAAAILKEIYGITAPMYPPLLPDSVARIDSITDGSSFGGLCLAVDFWRAGAPARLTAVRPDQYFGINVDGIPLDTSQVWFRLSPRKPNRVLVGLRSGPITLNHAWRLTYDAVASAQNAPITTIDQGDTIFAAGFDRLPVVFTPDPTESVKSLVNVTMKFSVVSGEIYCLIGSIGHQVVSVGLCDIRGVTVRRQQAILEEGENDLRVSTDGLASGSYWLILRDEQGTSVVEKAIVIR